MSSQGTSNNKTFSYTQVTIHLGIFDNNTNIISTFWFKFWDVNDATNLSDIFLINSKQMTAYSEHFSICQPNVLVSHHTALIWLLFSDKKTKLNEAIPKQS